MAGSRPVSRKPKRSSAEDWSYVHAPRGAARTRSASVGRLWRLAILIILAPVLVMTGLRAYRQLPSVAQATELVTGAISRELEVPGAGGGTLSLHAKPSAEVFIDGELVGETPLEDVQVEIGPHEIRFHHAFYGDRVREIVATRAHSQRVSVDLTRP